MVPAELVQHDRYLAGQALRVDVKVIVGVAIQEEALVDGLINNIVLICIFDELLADAVQPIVVLRVESAEVEEAHEGLELVQGKATLIRIWNFVSDLDFKQAAVVPTVAVLVYLVDG